MVRKTGITARGIFGAGSLVAARTCERILADATDADLKAIAREVIKGIRRTQACIKDGKADLAARYAWDAGMNVVTAVIKWRSECDALRGQKVAAGGRKAAEKTKARNKVKRDRRKALMAELVPSLGVQGASAECEARLPGEKPGARVGIERQYYRSLAEEAAPRQLKGGDAAARGTLEILSGALGGGGGMATGTGTASGVGAAIVIGTGAASSTSSASSAGAACNQRGTGTAPGGLTADGNSRGRRRGPSGPSKKV
jgi:hypothetical protein